MDAMTTTDTYRERRQTVANTIMRQIPSWLRGACGCRNWVALNLGLQFDCRGRANYRIIVRYNEGADTYDIEAWTRSRAPRMFASIADCGPEALVDLVDQIDRGALSA